MWRGKPPATPKLSLSVPTDGDTHRPLCGFDWEERAEAQLAAARLSTAQSRRTPNRVQGTEIMANFENMIGGRGGIRTHGTLAGTPVFKTGALNHSATLPNFIRLAYGVCQGNAELGLNEAKSSMKC
jgi:hypothetical protein